MQQAPADILTDLIVAELPANITAWEFPDNFAVLPRDMPDFEQIEATDQTQIQVAPFDGTPTAGRARDSVGGDQKIGICIVRRLEFERGQPASTLFRHLKSLAFEIYLWAHDGVTGYEKQVTEVQFPSWYDFAKAKSGTFMTLVSPIYRQAWLTPAYEEP